MITRSAKDPISFVFLFFAGGTRQNNRRIYVASPVFSSLFPLQFAATPGIASAFHFVGCIIDHGIVKGQLFSGFDFPHGHVHDLTADSTFGSQE